MWEAPGCPSVSEVRPCTCDRCGAVAVSGGRVVLQGHGVVTRQRLGPGARGEAPQVALQQVRRYRCRACGRVMRVTHQGLLKGKHYGAATIAEALVRWGLLREPAERVRRALSPWRAGAASTGWRSLQRWAEQAVEGRIWQAVSTSLQAPVRALAERAALVLASMATSVEGGLMAQLWEAAMHAR